MTKDEIKKYLLSLNDELRNRDVIGELYLFGGAVMTIVFNAREQTKDIDALFKPVQIIRECANEVAEKYNLDKEWLNDGVKGFLSEKNDFTQSEEELSNLRVYFASAQYILAMKCLSARTSESNDIMDIKFLINKIGVKNSDEAISLIEDFFPLKRIPQKTLYILDDIFSQKKESNDLNNNTGTDLLMEITEDENYTDKGDQDNIFSFKPH
ncbi:MAG: hypothetical protein DDT19_00580 [Syntrophomonadaceae bacterium]|nr:hypothetical protein [Bacillota bacterium]